MSETFTGFPPEALTFFKRLERNNKREWFLKHKHVYDETCVQPMQRLVADLDPRTAPKIFRIHRDLRFSADKRPYKTHIATVIDGHYVMVSKDGLYVGRGMYRPEPARLQRFREAVADDDAGRALQRIVTSLRRKGYDVDTHETTTSMPRGYRADHPRADLLRMKDLYAGKEFAPEAWLATPAALSRIKKVMADIKPLGEWLRMHVG
jgi:uncharacterized protein (TIGR02453 family)